MATLLELAWNETLVTLNRLIQHALEIRISNT